MEDFSDSVIIAHRLSTDSGTRTVLDEAIQAFRLNRADLEAELEAEIAAGEIELLD